MKKFLLSLLCLISFMAINAETKTIDVTFSNYTAGTQYAKNEAHVINESLTIYTTECHFTTELRIYSSDSNNGYAVSNELPGAITQMTFNAGNKKDVLNVYGSTDGSSWKLVEGISITSTSYKDYSLDFPTNSSYTYFKLDVEGNQQIRIKKMSVTYTTSTGGGEEPGEGGGEEPGEGGGEEPGDDPVVPEIPTKGDTYRLVTSDSELEANEKYIIVAAEYDYAMSTTQNSNNRGQNVITKNGNLITLSNESIANVQVLTLEQGTIDDTWAFNTGSGYLYAAGGTSKNNYLRTKNNKDEVASAIIAVSTEGIASIVFQGEVSRNTLKYNPSGSLFACYAPDNSQKDVSLYKYIKTVATPVISKDGDDMISITCATEGATIYYTIDGTTPTTSSTQYTDAFKLTVSSLTVNAIAVKDGWKNSTVASEALVPTAIEEVGVDAGEAVYYNLQGVKVANPENGIFIKKQGAKATKVIL